MKRNRELRIDYMMQKINEDCMKILLQRAEKKTLKEAETREVYQMVCNTAEDIIFRFYRYIENLPTACEDWNGDILKEMDNMLEYANECIEDICKTYNCKLYPFSMNERRYMQLVVIQ
jgi:glutaredoxin 2